MTNQPVCACCQLVPVVTAQDYCPGCAASIETLSFLVAFGNVVAGESSDED